MNNENLKENLKKLNFNEILSYVNQIKNLTLNNNEIKNLNNNIFFIKNFNLKGNILNIIPDIYDNNEFEYKKYLDYFLFNVNIEIKTPENQIFLIKIKRIKKDLKEKLIKLNKNTNNKIYFINLKAKINKKNIIIFKSNFKTKIFLNIMGTYLIELTKSNMNEYIDCYDFDKLYNFSLKILDKNYLDYNNILTINNVKNTVINKNFYSHFNDNKLYSFIGIVTKIYNNKNSNNEIYIEIQNIIDLNKIKLLIINNNKLLYNIEIGFCCLFKNYTKILNNNFNIILKNNIFSYNEILFYIDNKILQDRKIEKTYIKLNNIRSFVSNHENNFENLINLSNIKCLNRTVQKYFIIFKNIISLEAFYIINYNKIKNYNNLKLKGKFLIDDGTYEANIIIKDKNIIKLFNLNDNDLNQIYELLNEEKNYIKLYSKERNFLNTIDFNRIKYIYKNNFIVYGYCYSRGEYYNNDNKLGSYFNNILINTISYKYENNNINENDLVIIENKKNKLIKLKEKLRFINGELYIDKKVFNFNEYYIQKRPCLYIIELIIIEQ